MRNQTILAAITIALAMPGVTSAQHAGFSAGIARPQHSIGRHAGGGHPPAAVVRQNPYTGGYIYAHNAYYGPYGGPLAGYITPPGYYAPTGTVVYSGVVIVNQFPRGAVGVGSHPVRPPVIIVPSARDRQREWNRRYAEPRATYVPRTPVVAPRGGAIVGRTDQQPQPARGHDEGIRIGSTRAEVLGHYGQPRVSMANRAGEALVFGPTTILIQNGVVTQITTR
jgi:hypothetical protein